MEIQNDAPWHHGRSQAMGRHGATRYPLTRAVWVIRGHEGRAEDAATRHSYHDNVQRHLHQVRDGLSKSMVLKDHALNTGSLVIWL